MSRRTARFAAVAAALVFLAGAIPAQGVRCRMGSDCEDPCCNGADDDAPSIVPILPCCNATIRSAVQRPAAVSVSARPTLDVIAVVHTAHGALAPVTRAPERPAQRQLRAPPLYEKHCALLI